MLLKDNILSKKTQVLYTTLLNWHENTTAAEIIFNTKSLHNLDSIPTHILFNYIAYSLAENTYINVIDNTMDISVSNVNSDDAVCKITNNGYLKELTKLTATKLFINNKEINENISISIGDSLNIENVESKFDLIKVNRYET